MHSTPDQHAASGRYGDEHAELYDLMYGSLPDWKQLPALCRRVRPAARTVLEFGIGNGRLALPLAEEGFEVTGLEASGVLAGQLAARARDLPVDVVVGDFRERLTQDRFDLCLLMTNTLFMTEGVADQRRVLRRAAEALAPDGMLIVETYDPQVYLEKPAVSNFSMPLGDDALLTDTVIVDRLNCSVHIHHTVVRRGEVTVLRERSSWLTPRELDLVCEEVGLKRTLRFADLAGSPITDSTRNVVSCYERR